MNLEKVKTVHDVLIECIDISTDIDSAARSFASSDYCPSKVECCTAGYCCACWKHWLESEVTRNGE